ncbi:MAG TPA: hypothetical protein GXX57_04240 [Firmicutes bacterium]|jgi:hypothetical protein|nr:hypothetical protein [Bacillota bacterium]
MRFACGVKRALSGNDIAQLVDWLASKNEDVRYQAFLLLQHRSALFDDVYPFWDTFYEKLKSLNSYQRSIGLMLIAENVRWDTENRMEEILDGYLVLLNDAKPNVVRQCIQSLGKIVSAKPSLSDIVASRLISFDIMAMKETMRKSILLDILNLLLIIREEQTTAEVESFISNALSGEILDKKTSKQIENLLG